MPIVPAAWADVMFAATPNTNKLHPSEVEILKAALNKHYSASASYLTGAVTVLPTALISPAGQVVVTAGSAVAQTGATTTPIPVTGVGTIT